ncbi:MAG: CocE/NonD family hydrolase [Acidobacteria bacterium]|nr:CocE/NonD family hydrolase [Acidobacteriota bacterium]
MKKYNFLRILILTLLLLFLVDSVQIPKAQSNFEIRANYTKMETSIPMRDGTKLFTAIYLPKETSKKYPIMLLRTPYSVAPYGTDAFRTSLGPNEEFAKEGYIFVYQDVRGKYLSEGEFINMRPHQQKKDSPNAIDESTDTYDTIEWLLKNIPNHNERVGMWGISYPGFYTSAGSIDSHPALKAVSPQAPIGDWFKGDDFHHNGVFFLPHAFNFLSSFGLPRPTPTTESPKRFEHGTPDGYKFFLEMGSLKNANEKHLNNKVAFWDEVMQHGNYDEFWQSRNLLPNLRNIKAAVMTVGGWFDAENLYGALNTYKFIEEQNPNITNTLVMGPWVHGGWSRFDGDTLKHLNFASKTSLFYRENIELPFFNFYLKDKGNAKLPEAYVFETGSNSWKTYEHWPPKNVETKSIYLQANGGLSFEQPKEVKNSFDEYISDPNKPVPFINGVSIGMTRDYMGEDQRFASQRTDVLTYKSEPLNEDMHVAGPLTVTMYVSTSGTDSDWIVKLIDVYPDSRTDVSPTDASLPMGGFQMLVRGEPMRGKFRESFSLPKPMTPGKVTKIEFVMPDVNHAFLKGHRIMVQVQSSWFPLTDRNPQKFVDIYNAQESDFQKATQRVYHSKEFSSHIKLNVVF